MAKKRFLSKKSQIGWVSLTVLLTVAAFSVAVLFDNEKVSVGAVLALLVTLFGLVLDMHRRIDLELLREENEAEGKVEEFQRANPGILREHIGAVLDIVNATLSVQLNERGYTVESRSQALETYHDYWAILAKEQQDLAKRSRDGASVQGYRVRAVHATNIDIWTKEDWWLSRSLFDQQRRFTEAGGEIERVVINAGDTPNKACQQAIARMKEAGVKVFYKARQNSDWRQRPNYDFMLVGLPGSERTHTAVIWGGTDEDGHPTKTIYRSNPMHGEIQLNDKWKECMDGAARQ